MSSEANKLPMMKYTNDKANDLFNIEKGKSIAWGGYKGKFKSLHKKASGTRLLNGVSVFNRLWINEKAADKKSTQSKLLKHIGLTDEDLDSMYYDLYNKKGVDSTFLDWSKILENEQKDFDYAIKILKERTEDIAKVKVTHSTRRYLDTIGEVDRTAVPISSSYGKLSGYYLDVNAWENVGTDTERLVPAAIYESIEVALLDNTDLDITENYSPEVLEGIKSMYLTSQSEFIEFDSITKLGETSTEDSEGVLTYTVEAEEILLYNIPDSFNTTFQDYTAVKNPEMSSLEEPAKAYDNVYNSGFWRLRDSWISDDENGTKFFETDNHGNIYLRVDSVKRMTREEYSYIIGTYLKIGYETDSNFFYKLKTGIGNFFKMLLELAGKLVDLMMHIPSFRATFEVIVWIYVKTSGKSFEDARRIMHDVFAEIIVLIVIVVVTALITVATGGTATYGVVSQVATFISAPSFIGFGSIAFSTYNIYNAITRVEQSTIAQIKDEKQQKLDDEKEPEEEDNYAINNAENFEVTNDMLFNGMFQLLTLLNDSIEEKYIKGDEFNKELDKQERLQK